MFDVTNSANSSILAPMPEKCNEAETVKPFGYLNVGSWMVVWMHLAAQEDHFCLTIFKYPPSKSAHAFRYLRAIQAPSLPLCTWEPATRKTYKPLPNMFGIIASQWLWIESVDGERILTHIDVYMHLHGIHGAIVKQFAYNLMWTEAVHTFSHIKLNFSSIHRRIRNGCDACSACIVFFFLSPFSDSLYNIFFSIFIIFIANYTRILLFAVLAVFL